MVAEQTTHSRYWASPSLPAREIDLVARVETGRDAETDVDTELLYDPLPAAWDDAIARELFAGVHAGLAAVGAPLPAGGVRVRISELRISPPLAGDPSPTELRSVGETVRAIAAATVEALWTGLRQASSEED